MNTDYYTDDINDSEELNHIQKKLHNIFNDKVQVHVSMPKTYRNSNITAFHQDYKTKLINYLLAISIYKYLSFLTFIYFTLMIFSYH